MKINNDYLYILCLRSINIKKNLYIKIYLYTFRILPTTKLHASFLILKSVNILV